VATAFRVYKDAMVAEEGKEGLTLVLKKGADDGCGKAKAGS
jgi:hypothetical protein